MISRVQVRRVYDPPTEGDGFRVLVDRLWPRGVTKERAALDAWLRELAPSDALRRWYGHDPARWPEFAQRYQTELDDPARAELLARLEDQARQGIVTLLCAAKDVDHSNAAVIAATLRARLAHARA